MGLHAVRAVLLRGADRIVTLTVAAGRDDARVVEILRLARERHVAVTRADTGVHQGVVAEVRPLRPWMEDDLIDALGRAETPIVLVLDGVQDPHNLGACLRTADACGAVAVVVPRDRAAQLTPAVRKVAAGAAETTPVVVVTNLVRTLKLMKEAGLWIVGAAAEADRLAQDVDLKGPIALVMGAEGSGLRHLTRQTCDMLVRLPQVGAVESLNVSVAAGMLLYEAVRQREEMGTDLFSAAEPRRK